MFSQNKSVFKLLQVAYEKKKTNYLFAGFTYLLL